MAEFLLTLVLSASAFLLVYWLAPYLTPRLTGLARRLDAITASRIDFVFNVIVLVAVVFFTARAFHHYESFNSWHEERWNIDRVVVGLLQGDSPLPYWADRYNPIVAAFVPLQAVWNDPRVIVLAQSVGLALSVVPLYWFARPRLGRPLALVAGLGYLVSPQLAHLNSGDIFEVKFTVPLLALALFFLLRRRHAPFFVAFALALLVKEDVAVLALGCAVYLFFVQRQRALGLALGGSSIVLILLITEILYPTFHEGRPFYIWAERYAYLGNTLGTVVHSIVSNPSVALARLSTPDRIEYLFYLLRPWAGSALIGFEVLAIMVPALAVSILSEAFPWDLGTYFQAPLVPFLFFGGIVGLERLLKWGNRGQARAELALLAFLVAGSSLYRPDTWTRLLNPAYFTLDAHSEIGHALIRQIPAGATVGAQVEFILALHGTRQYQVRQFDPHWDARQADYIFGDSTRFWYGFFQPAWEHWRASGYFDVVTEWDGYFLLQRKTDIDPSRQSDTGWGLIGYIQAPNSFHRPVDAAFSNGMTLLGYAAVPSLKIRTGERLQVIAEWRAEHAIDARFLVLARIVDARGYVWVQVDRDPIIPTRQWEAGDLIRDQYTFDLPKVMPPGDYAITFAIWDAQAQARVPITASRGEVRDTEVVVQMMPVERDTTPFPREYLPVELSQRDRLGDLELIGSTEMPARLRPGEEFELGLYWQASIQPQEDVDVVWQLRDASGHAIVLAAGPPVGGAYPTSKWQAGEILLDWHTLTVPRDWSPGKAQLTVELRRASDGSQMGEATLGDIEIGN